MFVRTRCDRFQLGSRYNFYMRVSQFRTGSTKSLGRKFLCGISYAKKVTECNDPGLTVTGGYGNGLIEFNTIEMGHSGVIKDITVCQVVTDSGEVKNYLPSRGGQSISKELVKNKIGSVK